MEGNPVIELREAQIFHSRDPYRKAGSRRGELVLDGVNLRVGKGEMVYLIGRVGSGKSSLLKTLYAELPLCSGQGSIAGFDLRRLRRRDIPRLRRSIGVVFQDYRLLTDRNAYANLYYVMRATGWRNDADTRRRIGEVLKLVGLENKAYRMPFELSGGEQQRLSIARALVNSPGVILADEPTGNLDPAAAEEIIELFRRIVGRGSSIVMSTHNISNIQQYPSRTIRFCRGGIEEIDIRSVLSF